MKITWTAGDFFTYKSPYGDNRKKYGVALSETEAVMICEVSRSAWSVLKVIIPEDATPLADTCVKLGAEMPYEVRLALCASIIASGGNGRGFVVGPFKTATI